jgi:hypothetical protein
MDSFRLNFPIEKANFSIEHGQQVLLIGSCFSDEIALKFKESGHLVAANPFGTVFHPLVIANFIKSLLDDSVTMISPVQREDVFLAWEANSSFHAYSESALLKKANQVKQDWKTALQNASVLLITVGTAFGYYLQNGELVGNCHKFPAANFEKRLSESNEIIAAFTEMIAILKNLNPSLKIVFTVSPVRHIKDGIIENNLSKARLLEAVHAVQNEGNVSYFPSYEIVVDELRDYRFYKTDRVHPTEEAVTYVWKRFSETYFSDTTIALNEEVAQYHSMKKHNVLFTQSISSTKFIQSIENQRLKLIDKGAVIST